MISHIGQKILALTTDTDYVSLTWFVVLFFSSLLIRTKSFFDLILIYIWTYCLLGSFFPIEFWARTITDRVTTENQQKSILLLVAILAILLKSDISDKLIKNILRKAFYVFLFFWILALPFNAGFISGLIPNKSLGGIMIAALIPYAGSLLFMVLAALLIVATAHSSSAILAVLCLLLPFINSRINALKCALIAGVLGIIGFIFTPQVLSGGSRFDGYKLFFLNFLPLEWVFGKGPGSFFGDSIRIQSQTGFDMMNGFWVWMHSDPLQLLYEYGIVGWYIVGYTIYRIFKIADRQVKASLLAILGGSLVYYPHHQPFHLALVFLNLRLVYTQANDHN